MIPVIILGSGNSGSSAVLDYVRGRNDVVDPLDGQEFRLIQERDGLSGLHRALTVEFHPDNAMYAVIQFGKLAARLGEESKKLRIPPRLGYGFEKRIPGYGAAIADFIENITVCHFGKFPLVDMLQFTTLDWIRYMSGGLPKSKNIVARKPIPVPSDQFMRHAEKLIERLFFKSQKGKSALVFDQAGSFWSPVTSTQYFGDRRRIIVVTRDPCDVYAEQRKKFGGGAKEFIRYHNAVMAHISRQEWSDEKVLEVTFERFVLDHEGERNRICAHLGIDPRTKSMYDPETSRGNVGKYKNVLRDEEVKIIRGTE